ncbi:hypothetical protein [Kribbella sindirgiensis]|uniref:Uncharacterized protein n=1 Tax=Kribbella sindirgiensis TaxID=1124744 RepID=A0A4R0ITH6_9ACTN|nr:hypothetical protein [Kribbella sindirgiensis]TCC37171.1 hypothetical protein E0H50_10950 [Kribbella sindirgiensis]
MRTHYAALVLVGLLTGCASEPAPAAAPERTSSVVPRPLTTGERAELEEAEAELTRRCMEREGFQLYLTKPPAGPPALPYGNDDVRFARRSGLGLATVDSVKLRAADPNIRYVESLPADRQAAYGRALNGDPKQAMSAQLPDGSTDNMSRVGCTASAQAELYGDGERWFQVSAIVNYLPAEYLPKIDADRRFRTALANWTACMRRAGHPVSSPAQLRTGFPAFRAAPSAKEVAAAIDEATCSKATQLTATGKRIEREHQARVYRAHRDAVLEYQTLSVAALDRARTY